MNDFRMMLGVCPQHDILFDLLTPVEHLRLFDLLKVQMSQKQKMKFNKLFKILIWLMLKIRFQEHCQEDKRENFQQQQE